MTAWNNVIRELSKLEKKTMIRAAAAARERMAKEKEAAMIAAGTRERATAMMAAVARAAATREGRTMVVRTRSKRVVKMIPKMMIAKGNLRFLAGMEGMGNNKEGSKKSIIA